MTFNLSLNEVTQDRFLELKKMTTFLNNSGAATIERQEFLEGMDRRDIVHVGGQPIATLIQTPGKFYYGEHCANFPPGPLTWGDL